MGQRSGMDVAYKREGNSTPRKKGRKQTPSATPCKFARSYMFLISKCRGESDLDLCMTSGIVKSLGMCSANFWFLSVFGRKIRRKLVLRTSILFAISKVMSRPRSDSPLSDILIWGTYGKFVWKNKMLALSVCLPQPCLIAGRSCRIKITSKLLSFFLSWFSKTQPNHWTKRIASTWLAT